MPQITYLIPVCNEIKTVREAINKVLDFNFNIAEILIIDNCSNDGSIEIIKEFKKHKNIKIILKNKNYGWGDTVKRAMKLATGKYLFIHHSDNEFDLNVCKRMYKLSESKSYDVIFGSRLKNLKTFKNYISALTKNHYFIATIIFTTLINILYGKNFTDTTGSKFHRLKTIRKIKIMSNNVSFEYEQICKLCEPGISSLEIYTKYAPRKDSKGKTVKWYHLFLGIHDIIFTRLFKYKKIVFK